MSSSPSSELPSRLTLCTRLIPRMIVPLLEVNGVGSERLHRFLSSIQQLHPDLIFAATIPSRGVPNITKINGGSAIRFQQKHIPVFFLIRFVYCFPWLQEQKRSRHLLLILRLVKNDSPVKVYVLCRALRRGSLNHTVQIWKMCRFPPTGQTIASFIYR